MDYQGTEGISATILLSVQRINHVKKNTINFFFENLGDLIIEDDCINNKKRKEKKLLYQLAVRQCTGVGLLITIIKGFILWP